MNFDFHFLRLYRLCDNFNLYNYLLVSVYVSTTLIKLHFNEKITSTVVIDNGFLFFISIIIILFEY